HYEVQTEEIDCGRLMSLLREMEIKNLGNDRKLHFKSLRDDNKMRCIWNELKSLLDADLLRGKFIEQIDWKEKALSNIGTIKEKIKNEKSPAHEYLFEKISKIDVKNLTYDDPLCISVIDLDSDQFQVPESDYDTLVGRKAGIRRLSKDMLIKNVCSEFVEKREEARHMYKFVLAPTEIVTHDRWIEQEHDRAQIAKGITDVLLQEIKSDILRRVTKGSENSLVESIARLIDATIYRLPIGCEVEVTRGERQSLASKYRKAQQMEGSRGDKPDLMIRAFLRQKWDEIVYFESGKWKSTNQKIRDDHNKLVQFSIDGDYLIIHGLIREKGVRYYFPIARARIPFKDESTKEVEEFVHVLMTLRGLINSLQKKTRKF
ncbi:3861_t:CDS:2, partial [Entrophospora sp. SA101]